MVVCDVTAAVGGSQAPLSATVKVLGPTTVVKQMKDTSSAGGVLPSRTGTAVVSLQPVLIRPGAAITVASSQASTVQASVISGASRLSTSAASSMLAGVQQTISDIVQQEQAQTVCQNTVGFLSTPTTNFVEQSPATVVASPPPSVTTVDTAASQSHSKSSPYVMRLRNQRS